MSKPGIDAGSIRTGIQRSPCCTPLHIAGLLVSVLILTYISLGLNWTKFLKKKEATCQSAHLVTRPSVVTDGYRGKRGRGSTWHGNCVTPENVGQSMFYLWVKNSIVLYGTPVQLLSFCFIFFTSSIYENVIWQWPMLVVMLCTSILHRTNVCIIKETDEHLQWLNCTLMQW